MSNFKREALSLALRMTLMRYWLAATLITVSPLLLAAGYFAYTLQRQIVQQRQVMHKQDDISSIIAGLRTQTTELVRTARQYQLLVEPAFLDLFNNHRRFVSASVGELENLYVAESSRQLLHNIRSTIERVQSRLEEPSQNSKKLQAELLTLHEDVQTLVQISNKQQRSEIRRIESEFNHIVSSMLILLLAALPVAVLILTLGSFLISKPIWQLTYSIRRLGKSKFHSPISVKGPADLTELGQHLDWMRRQILAADQQKMAFVQHVTHELKTPLAAIIDAGNLLIEEIPAKLDPAQKPILEILRQNAWNLQHLIQQLLNFNAVTHGIMVHRSQVDLVSLCEKIKLALQTSGYGQQLNWRFIGETRFVNSDPRLMEMVLSNLLTNAVQYCGDNGTIMVTWSQQPDNWQLVIRDDGPGIPEEELDQVFLPFFQGATPARRKGSHNGLGLAIVKSCVDFMGGDIRISSAQGQGTTFFMHFPSLGVETSK